MRLTSVVTLAMINGLLFTNIDGIYDSSYINPLFRHKSINDIFIFDCNTELSTVALQKKLYRHNFKVCIKRISDEFDNDSLRIPHRYNRIGVVLESRCAGWRGVAAAAGAAAHDYFKSPFSWVVAAPRLAPAAALLRQLRLELDSDVTVAVPNHDSIDFYELYHTGFGKNGQFITRKIGYWRDELIMEEQNRADLKGLVVKTVVVINHNQRVVNQTFTRYLAAAAPGLHSVDPMHKFKYFEMLNYYKDLYNISYEFQRTNSWGYPTNGSFDGMVGALQRREAELAGSPMFVRTDRAAAVDYAAETWQTRPCFIFLVPRHPGGVYAIYWRPLSARVWAAALAVLALASALLAAMLRLRGDSGVDRSPALAFLFVWGAVCQQGMALERQSTAIKQAALSVLMFALTLYQYYNATVVSTLLHEAPNTVRSLRDLARSDLRVGVEDVLYIRDFFKRTADPEVRELVRRKGLAFLPPEAGLRRVRRGGFAFHVDSALAYRYMQRSFTEREACAAAELDMMVPQYLGAAVPRRGALREPVARGLRAALERGLARRLRARWDAARPACRRTPRGAAVTLREVSAPLLALAAGAAAAVAALFAERLLPPPRRAR